MVNVNINVSEMNYTIMTSFSGCVTKDEIDLVYKQLREDILYLECLESEKFLLRSLLGQTKRLYQALL